MKYVIIGNSAAAVGCIEGIRCIDKTGEITLVSDEKHHTYSRPLISYLLLGKTDTERMKYRPDSFYADNGVKTILGVRAEKIDEKGKKLSLSDGETLFYDKLMVATGSRPFVPPMEGLDRVKNKFSFMTLDDAQALRGALGEKKDKRVLIIGAGLIGLKCAEGIRDLAADITVADLADRVMPSVLDAGASEVVKAHLEKNGLRFMLSDSCAKFDEGTALMKSGKSVDFDILVLAVGVRPNTALVADAGGKVNRGICADELGRTSLKDVWAAGDCCECKDVSCGQERILALLPNAYRQGETAGYSMAGFDKPFENAIPMNSIGFFGLHIVTAGSYEGVPFGEEDGSGYRRLFVNDGLLKGFIIVGDVNRSGIYTYLVRERIPLTDVDFDIIREKPQLIALSRAYRDSKLGGVE